MCETRPTAEAEMEMRQMGEYFTKNARKTRPEPLTDTLTVSKSDSEWILAVLREKQAKDQEKQWKEEARQAQKPVATVLGGQQRSIDHPAGWTQAIGL